MTNETVREGGADAPEPPAAVWRPSRMPEHRSMQPSAETRIVERRSRDGTVKALLRRMNTPMIKVAIGIGLFVTGAVAVDAVLDSGWAQKERAPMPSKHARGGR